MYRLDREKLLWARGFGFGASLAAVASLFGPCPWPIFLAIMLLWLVVEWLP